MVKTFKNEDGTSTVRRLGLYPFEAADFLVGFESQEAAEVRVDLTLGGTVRVSTTVPPKGFAFAMCGGFMVPTMCIDYHAVVPSVSPPGGPVPVYALVDDKTRAAFQRLGARIEPGGRTLAFGSGGVRVSAEEEGSEKGEILLPDMRGVKLPSGGLGWFM